MQCLQAPLINIYIYLFLSLNTTLCICIYIIYIYYLKFFVSRFRLAPIILWSFIIVNFISLLNFVHRL